jgi:hypothetical protein
VSRRIRPLLVNEYEIATDVALREIGERRGVRVCPKVRIADVLKIESSGLTNEEYSYSLRSHFDFVIVDRNGAHPHFAVEFDGPRHDVDPGAILRDQLKDGICTRLGLPLLRIDAAYLHRVSWKRMTVVGWLVDLWYLQEAFHRAQALGYVPPDEDFCYWSLFEIHENGKLESFAIDQYVRQAFEMAARRGICLARTPEVVFTPDHSPDGYVRAYAILALPNEKYLIGSARCRVTEFTFRLGAFDLVRDLAVVDLGEKFRAYCIGGQVTAGLEDLASLRQRTPGWLRVGQILPV